MPAKKAKTREQRVEAVKTRITRLKKKISGAVDDVKKRLARKRVKRAQRRKRALEPPKPKAKAT
jgi:hypothetical protein